MSQQDASSLREDLYRVVHYYADLAQLARQGAIDPLSQIGRILEKRVPYLLIVIGDLLPLLEREIMTYHEVLYNIIRQAQQFPDQKVIIQSRKEIEKIEAETKVFMYAVKWMDTENNLRPARRDVDRIQKLLTDLNRKYRERYAQEDHESTAIIPCYIPPDSSESDEAYVSRAADLARRALLQLHYLMIEHEPSRPSFFFSRPNRKEMEEELVKIVWFLFRCGFTVDRIASGYYKDHLADFLNEYLLQSLIDSRQTLQTLAGVSQHLSMLSIVDFGSLYELPSDYCSLEDPKEVARHIKQIKSGKRRGHHLLGMLAKLNSIYDAHPNGQLVQKFLAYRYSASFGDYHGTHRQFDRRAKIAMEMYRTAVDRSAMEKRTEEDIEESGRFFSSKTRDEMAGLIKLIMESLEDPKRVSRGKVKVLGDISSGAMGKVSVGIFRGRIVALKAVKAQLSTSFGDPMALLEYEAAMHATVQSPEQHPYIVDYYGLVEQDGQKLLINGYHPSDSLTQLVEKNWTARFKPPLSLESKLNLANFEVIVRQLLECLLLFRDRGVIHRDLKTDNILYLVDSGEMVKLIKVIDFGVALCIRHGCTEDLFKGKVVGTFSYMAPEQVRGRPTFQSDLYSVGAIFTVLLTGKLPMIFPKTTSRQELAAQLVRVESEPRPRVAELNPALTKNSTLEFIAATVDRMIDLDQMARPTVDEVQQAFDDIFEQAADQKHAISIFYHRG